MTTTPSTYDKPFKVFITPEALAKLNHYATAALPTEIGGLARLQVTDDHVFVTDVHMMPQHATGGTFEFSAETTNAFTRMMVKAGRAAELPEWCSIVHSHPVGMGPSMSGTDITAIQRFAEESDAFSLIISASRNADSKRMYMHYCGKVRGQNILIKDIPVNVAYSARRLEIAQKVTDLLVAEFGSDIVGKQDNVIEGAVRAMLNDKIPAMFDTETVAMKAAIEEEVKTLIIPPTSTAVATTASRTANGGANSRSWRGNRGSDSSDYLIEGMVSEGGNWSDERWAAMTDEDADAWSRAFDQAITRPSERMLYWTGVQTLQSLAEGNDPENPRNPVSLKRREKCRELAAGRIALINADLLDDYNVCIGDMVTVDYSQMNDGKGVQKNERLENIPHPITDFIEREGECASFVVGGEQFWPNELVVISRWDGNNDMTDDEAEDATDTDPASVVVS